LRAGFAAILASVTISGPACALLGVLLLAACTGRTAVAPTGAADRPPAPAPAAFRVFATGDTRGYLQPCGCAAGIFGGLPRRATYLRAARRPGDLYVDLGNVAADRSPPDETTLAYGLRALRLLACDALVPGERDVRFGARFEEIAAREGPPVVCANFRRADTGARVFAPWLLHTLPDGRRVAVIGVTVRTASPPPGRVVDAPAEAVRVALAELGGRADAVIVAASDEERAGRRIAGAFPGAALVLTGRAPRESGALADRTVSLGDEGQYVARVEFGADLAAASARRTWLGDEFADEPDLAALAAACRAEVSSANAGLSADLVAALRGEGFAGSAACGDCHAPEHETWRTSRHAGAVRSLEAKDAARDPSCLPCHLRDVPSAGDERGVGCEACHGPGSRHVASARAARVPDVRMPRLDGAASCAGCHDPRNSPQFDFAEYWRRIAHGPGRNR
jgi:hypothetical protein